MNELVDAFRAKVNNRGSKSGSLGRPSNSGDFDDSVVESGRVKENPKLNAALRNRLFLLCARS